MKRSRRLSRSGWRDRQKNSILVELTVSQKNVANALNSVVIILKNKVQFVTFPFFFMAELQNFLNATRIIAVGHYASQAYSRYFVPHGQHNRYSVFNMRHIIAVGHYASQAYSRYFVPHRQHNRYSVFNMRHIIAIGHYASQAHSRYFVPHRQHTAGSLCFT